MFLCKHGARFSQLLCLYRGHGVVLCLSWGGGCGARQAPSELIVLGFVAWIYLVSDLKFDLLKSTREDHRHGHSIVSPG